MLGGVAPIFLFTFFKNIPSIKDSVAAVPVVSQDDNQINLPPIPLYLDENLTGLYIDSENKSIDADTTIETLTSGATPITNQKAVNSTITINMVAKKDSIGLTILSAMMDIIYQKLTSKEYQVTYLHGAVTVFGGLLHAYSVQQNSENELCQITVTLVKNTGSTAPKLNIPVLDNTIGKVPGL